MSNHDYKSNGEIANGSDTAHKLLHGVTCYRSIDLRCFRKSKLSYMLLPGKMVIKISLCYQRQETREQLIRQGLLEIKVLWEATSLGELLNEHIVDRGLEMGKQ